MDFRTHALNFLLANGSYRLYKFNYCTRSCVNIKWALIIFGVPNSSRNVTVTPLLAVSQALCLCALLLGSVANLPIITQFKWPWTRIMKVCWLNGEWRLWNPDRKSRWPRRRIFCQRQSSLILIQLNPEERTDSKFDVLDIFSDTLVIRCRLHRRKLLPKLFIGQKT